MLTEVHDAEGTATVTGVPLSPFTGYQHGQVDVLAAARAGSYMRRRAFDHGWLQPSAVSDDATVFFVACDTRILPAAARGFISTVVLCSGEMFVVHVGNSSFALFFTLTASDSSEILGVMRLTYVSVSKTSRRPVPIPAEKRALLDASFANSTALRERLGATAPPPLAVQPAMAALLRVATAGGAPDGAPAVGDGRALHRRVSALREADFDFNRHLNQSMYQSFAIDTLKEACRVQAPGFAWALGAVPEALSAPIHADLAIEGLRIDYKQEIPLAALERGVEVVVVGEAAAAVVWFAVWAAGDAPYLAAVGSLSIRSA